MQSVIEWRQMRISDWLTYLVPQTMLKTSSRFNHDIRVIKEAGAYKLLVNGSPESGPYIETLWKYAVRQLSVAKEKEIKSILVLGVAGGTVIHMLREFYASASIVGIDIDEQMIALGNQYFGLSHMKNVTFVVADAKKFVSSEKPKLYDLIVIDLFIGREIPAFIRSESFMRDIHRLLRPKGVLLINYLKELDRQYSHTPMEHILKKRLSKVAFVDYKYNRFFLAKNGA
jgi:spermidine synthase